MHSEEIQRALGARIRAVRVEAQLTQAELAERANVSVGALKHLEAGSGATTSTLAKVLRALGEVGWIEKLGPRPRPFNPLEVLEARRRGDKEASPRQRARRPSQGAP